MNTGRVWYFVGGNNLQGATHGVFQITHQVTLKGPSLPSASHLLVDGIRPEPGSQVLYCLEGVVSNERYATSEERQKLRAVQAPIGRSEASLGAFIPIGKSQAWWDLAQDERRAILEDRSAHIALGLKALPAVARRLHHCRDLPEPQPFDFLTWFDFAEKDQGAFDDLLGALRATEEWAYVDRETEIRVQR